MTFVIKYFKFISVLGLLLPLGYNPFNQNTRPWYYNVFINFNVLPQFLKTVYVLGRKQYWRNIVLPLLAEQYCANIGQYLENNIAPILPEQYEPVL